MKILLSMLTLTKGKGGAERVATELANEMVRRGHQVALYASAESSEEPQYPLSQGATLLRIPLLPENVCHIQQSIADFAPECIFYYYSGVDLLEQYLLFGDLGIPLGAQECTNPLRVISNIYNEHKTLGMDRAFALRNAVVRELAAIRMVLPGYLDSLPKEARNNGVAFFNRFTLPEPMVQKDGGGRGNTIINIGGLKSGNKNGVALIKAFAELVDEFPDWQLKFFGKPGVDVSHLIRQDSMRQRVHLMGPVDNIHEHYGQADIHVICSFQEGCPNVICEAMLHGLPSIGFSDCPGTNELIEDNVDGLLVDRVEEVENLTMALRRLMGSEALRQRMGRSARSRAENSCWPITATTPGRPCLTDCAPVQLIRRLCMKHRHSSSGKPV